MYTPILSAQPHGGLVVISFVRVDAGGFRGLPGAGHSALQLAVLVVALLVVAGGAAVELDGGMFFS